ncbi:hypothetical protein AYO38_03175 [bacterium SCGC AG-212-C10]|nr:hypothetical protein AYO38_03175 [bacterium SCGC AG-212-C10]
MADAPIQEPGNAPAVRNGLALAAAIVAIGFAGSRLLGILRTVAIARAFGSSPELDAYWVAFRVPDLIFQVLAGATLGSAFIPVFIRLYRRESEARAWQLANTVLTMVAAATAALCVLGFLLAPVLVPMLAPGLGDDIGRHDELTDKAVSLTRFMLLSPMLFAISGMVTGILNARQRFLLPALAPILYNLAIIFGALVLAGPFGVEGLAAGVVLGAALHLAVQIPGLVRERMPYRPSFDWQDAAVREVGRLMGPRVIGLAAAQVNFLITTIFASRIGSGAIANLNYAFLVAQLPLAIFGMTISTAVFPTLAENMADDALEQMRRTISRALRAIMFLTIPATLGLVMLREPVTVTLLQRGEFSSLDAAVTASALGWYCLGIIPQAGIEIHSRAFYARGDTRTPVLLAVAAVLLNLVLSAALWSRFEMEGLAFAVSASSWLEWGVLYVLYVRAVQDRPEADLAAIARYTLCGAFMALFLAVSLALFRGETRLDMLLQAAAGTVAGAAVYHALAALFRVEDFVAHSSRITGGILRRFGRG